MSSNKSDQSMDVERCHACGGQRYVMPSLEDFVCALPANGWLTHYWTSPNDPESAETRTEPLAAWGITRKGEVHPFLKSEVDEATIEDASDDFAFIARARAPRQELDEIRREEHAERERLRALATSRTGM